MLVWASLATPNFSLEVFERRLRPIGLIAAAALMVTGTIQMGVNESYLGLFQIGNLWSAAMLAKHVLFLGMLVITSYAQWQIAPALDRTKLVQNTVEADKYRSRLKLTAYANLALGIIILLLTGIMTAVNT